MPTLAPVKIIIAGIDNFSATYSKAFSKIEKAGKKIEGVGKSLSTWVTLPVIGAGIAVVKTASNFEKSMNKVESVTFATGAEMEALRQTALKLGADSQFSASQSADAMFYLGQAGMKTNDILAVTPQVLNLAAASGIEMGRSAEILADTMNAMGLQVRDTGLIVDTLSATANASTISIEDIAETMKNAAPIAKQYGASLNDLSVATGFLGNIGIKGEQAGTTMKNIFLSLAAPTKEASKWFAHLNVQTKDLAGNPLPLVKVFSQLGNSLSKLPKADRLRAINDIFGMIPIAGAAALADDLGKVDSKFMKLTQDMSNVSGMGDKMARILMKGSSGAFEQFTGSLETLAITIASSGLLEALTGLIKRATEWVNKLSALNPNIIKFGVILAGIAAIAGPLLVVIGSLAGAVGSVMTGIAAAGGLAAIGAVIGPIVAVTGAFLTFGAAIAFVASNWEGKYGKVFGLILFWINPLAGVVTLLIAKWDKVVPYFNLIMIGLKKAFSWFVDGFGPIEDMPIIKGIKFLNELLEDALGWAGKLMGTAIMQTFGISEKTMASAGFNGEMVGKNYLNDNGLSNADYQSILNNIRNNKSGTKNSLTIQFKDMPDGLKIKNNSAPANMMLVGPNNYGLEF